jgi:two-component system OmpR family response regulator
MSVPSTEPRTAVRVLVIDDDRAVCDVVQHILRRAGFEALGAYDGVTGLHRAREAAPDLIMLDVKMPDLDGLETLARLREDSSTRHSVVVAFTALVIDADSLRRQGFDDIITKPILAFDLVERLTRVLQNRSTAGGAERNPSELLSTMWRRVNIA